MNSAKEGNIIKTDDSGNPIIFSLMEEGARWDNDEFPILLKFLAENKVAFNSVNKRGDTVLILAGSDSNKYGKKCMEDFVDKLEKSDLNKKNTEGETALIKCAQNYRDKYFAETLIKSGADPDLEDKKNKTALHYAVEDTRKDSLVEYLICKSDFSKLKSNSKHSFVKYIGLYTLNLELLELMLDRMLSAFKGNVTKAKAQAIIYMIADAFTNNDDSIKYKSGYTGLNKKCFDVCLEIPANAT